MLKVNQSYSKKVPAEGEYTSQSYHCQIEIELPDGLSDEELKEKAHKVFEFVRDTVEAELHNNATVQQPVQQMLPPPAQQTAPKAMPPQQPPVQQHYNPRQPPVQQHYNPRQPPVQQQYYDPQQSYPQSQPQLPAQYGGKGGVASQKQVNYLLSLVKRAGWSVQQLLQHCNVSRVSQIPAKTCSQLIQQFSGQAA